ncbi:hypothetical protein WN944_006891 [Citrus x changshan-huyou]|uniref:UDP-glycosyltransferases domain-containing protein n=1 Tax=Citrus x changshan-huyou TaxID=2935761 RepID=A0AAP0QTP2_9ROSI
MSSSVATAAEAEIWIVPFFGQGHLFLCIELCNQIASRNYKSTLIIPSHISATSTIPFSFHQYPLFEVTEISSSSPPPALSLPRFTNTLSLKLLKYPPHLRHQHYPFLPNASRPSKPLSTREPKADPFVQSSTLASKGSNRERAVYFLGYPRIWLYLNRILNTGLMGPLLVVHHLCEVHPVPRKKGPLEAGDQPHWMKEVEGSMALMFNTCDGLEGPFINYLANQLGKPVWGVGSLLPEQFYKSAGSKLHDHEMRTNRRSSNMTEDEIGGAGRLDPLRHLDKPAEGSYFRSGLDNKVGKKGLIIDGWAPQSLILNHQSTSGFLSHCGWNSTVEAIGCRVPILAWPIRGDQHYNAKFVINHLKVGI